MLAWCVRTSTQAFWEPLRVDLRHALDGIEILLKLDTQGQGGPECSP